MSAADAHILISWLRAHQPPARWDDLGNADLQRDLTVSQDNIGNMLSAQGDLTCALAAYRASLEISQRLAAADPGNVHWQCDL